ncbi:hypothetical protein WICMUC_003877 [Wickerhamomyces mucosus]|uniref:Zn(2)-C6 fungal-type domain-containing protein n=1 Tax=Wickerhamomyces mucosus TaxID=1378264 RepID=A0A9P8PJE0_9ASCO|nr:hypothetical protein WICMUC_003877 [Wickerhamomyces mucosus]
MSKSLSSLPFDALDGTDKRYKRNYQACLNCRTRKVRCDLGPVDAPHSPPCARCLRERRECIFRDSRRGRASTKKKTTEEIPQIPIEGDSGSTIIGSSSIPSQPTSNVYQQLNFQAIPPPQIKPHINTITTTTISDSRFNGNYNQQRSTIDFNDSKAELNRSNSSSTVNDDTQAIPPPNNSEFSTSQGALVFLARAAGSIARADNRDKINGLQRHQQFEKQSQPQRNVTTNSQDYLEEDSQKESDRGWRYHSVPPLIRPSGSQPLSIPAGEKPTSVRPNPSTTLAHIDYIGPNKLLTEKQAKHLINLFFLTLHPFFPHIPTQLHSPQVLAGYPILLCAILTISARYHELDEEDIGENGSDIRPQFDQNSKNIVLHERLWIYCQRLISQTVWAEASTRSIGTVLAFLLFTEWNPRAIHWRWSDYANTNINGDKEEDEKDRPKSGEDLGLTGLSAMRRSDRMAWMLIGSSVRLAQDMGFIDSSTKIFVATHIAETHAAMNLGKRSMLAYSLAEIDLDPEDNDELIDNKKQYQQDEEILNLDEESIRAKSLKKNQLKFSFTQKAKLELLKIMSLAYETIYSNNEKLKDNQLNHGQNLTILSILSPLIENWYKTYRKLLKPSNPKNSNQHCNLKNCTVEKHVSEITKQIDKESLICDYYYCQLYIYSLSLTIENSPFTEGDNENKKKLLNNIRLDEISKIAKFVEIAYNAAKEILNVAIRIHKLKMLKYMPIRWLTRIVRSVAFIVKCFLTLTQNKDKDLSDKSNSIEFSTILTLSLTPTEEIIQIIQKASIVLREASPDELHLCTRYSTILMYLCLEMKYRTKVSVNVPNFTALGEPDEDEELNEETVQFSNRNQQQVSSQSTNQQSLDNTGEFQQSGVKLQPQSNPHCQEQSVFPIQQQFPEFQDAQFLNFNYPQTTNASNVVQPLPDTVIDWFLKNDESIGLDFVEPWTEMIEQHLDKRKTT